jgi:hypothetical protein
MHPGDLVRQCPQPGSTIQVTSAGVEVFAAAHHLYDTFLSTPPVPLEVFGPEMGSALLRLLDACHDLLER